MTITVNQMWSRSSANTASADGTKFNAGFVSGYQITHAPDEKRLDIFNHEDLPVEGDVFTEGGSPLPGIYCVSRALNRVSPIYSVLTANFAGEYSDGDLEDNPLNAPPEVTRSNRITNVPIDSDFNGNPITNSIGEPFDGVTADISDFQIVIKRNFAAIDTFALRAYLRSHNSDTFDGWPPGTARLRTYSATEKRYRDATGSDTTYHDVTAVIEFHEPYNTINANAWYARYRNEGMYERIGVNVTFTGGDGTGAKGYVITENGSVTKVVVTEGGSGYTSAPSVIVTSANGFGFTGTAVLDGDSVDSVTVSNGGGEYVSQLVHATDDSKEPVSKPVLLAADGTRLRDTTQAVWNERPLSGPLPYNSLGLLDA